MYFNYIGHVQRLLTQTMVADGRITRPGNISDLDHKSINLDYHSVKVISKKEFLNLLTS